MCVSCGCGQVNDNHGDRRNITMDQVRAAAQAANTDEQTVVKNIQQGVSQGQGRTGWQQSQMGGQPGMGGQMGTGKPGQGYGGTGQGGFQASGQEGSDISEPETDY